MADCHGQIPTSTKVDQETREYLQREADERGVSRSEFIRRIFDAYRTIEEGEAQCPDCGSRLEFDI
jgi:uncharacterized protein (UPF0212 family)